MNHRGLLLLTIPVVGTILLAVVLLAPAGTEITPIRPGLPKREPSPARRAAASRAPAVSTPPEEIVRSIDEARIRTSYENYRMAVAAGNERLQKALQPTLTPHRQLAVQFAEEDVARSSDPVDQEIARRTLESLRR